MSRTPLLPPAGPPILLASGLAGLIGALAKHPRRFPPAAPGRPGAWLALRGAPPLAWLMQAVLRPAVGLPPCLCLLAPVRGRAPALSALCLCRDEWVRAMAQSVDGYDGRLHTDRLVAGSKLVAKTVTGMQPLLDAADPRLFRPLEVGGWVRAPRTGLGTGRETAWQLNPVCGACSPCSCLCFQLGARCQAGAQPAAEPASLSAVGRCQGACCTRWCSAGPRLKLSSAGVCPSPEEVGGAAQPYWLRLRFTQIHQP